MLSGVLLIAAVYQGFPLQFLRRSVRSQIACFGHAILAGHPGGGPGVGAWFGWRRRARHSPHGANVLLAKAFGVAVVDGALCLGHSSWVVMCLSMQRWVSRHVVGWWQWVCAMQTGGTTGRDGWDGVMVAKVDMTLRSASV
jgi:hypothetical protein